MWRNAWTLLGLLVAVCLFPAGASAQGFPLYFPYVVNDAQTSTEVILTNAGNTDATVALVGIRDDGSAAGSLRSVRVPAISQTILPMSMFPGRGWVLGLSDAQSVIGSSRVLSADRSAQDATPAAQTGTTIVLPFTPQASGSSTEIAIVNPAVYGTRVPVTLFDRHGGAIGSTELLLNPFAAYRGDLKGLFGADKDFSGASHLVARSVAENIVSNVVEITGFAVVRKFAQIPDDGSERIFARTDLTALPAVPVSDASGSIVFPHVNRDGEWFSLIGLVNLNSTSQNVTLTYSTASNANAATRTFSVPANGSLRMTTVDLFGSGSDSGSVKVTGSGALIGFSASGTYNGSAFTSSVGNSKGVSEFLFADVDETAPGFTGIVLHNDSPVQAQVELFLISPQGETVGTHSEILLPRERTVRLLRQYFLEGFNQKGGYVFARSSTPIFATEIMGVPDKTLTQLSPQPTRPGFNPPAQSRFAVRGRITQHSTGAPVPGVRVILSRTGSPDTGTTTDNNGEYFLSNLLPGDYVITPVQTGQMFSPNTSVVQLATGSRTVNFTRASLPAIESITVVTNDEDGQSTAGNNPEPFAVFGTAEVSLKIKGANFVTGQTLFFGSRAIPAENLTFTTSNTIFARLLLNSVELAEELARNGSYGKYDIAIGGQSPFDSSRSNAIGFYVVPPVPVLASVVSSTLGRAETFARYEINSPGETITAYGFGFREGAQILFNGGTSLNGFEIDTKFINSTQLNAYIPPQALRFGGTYDLRVSNASLLPEISGEAVPFQVTNLAPRISSINPSSPIRIIGPGPLTLPTTLTINGSNFHAGSTSPTSTDPGTLVSVYLKSSGSTVLPTLEATSLVFISSTQMLATIPFTTPGVYGLRVANVGPGGGQAEVEVSVSFYTSADGTPVIRGVDPLSPATRPAGSGGFMLTVYREAATPVHFDSGAWMNFGTIRLNRIAGDADPNSITVYVPEFLIASPGVVPISVTNPSTTYSMGGTSARIYFGVTP